MKFTFALLHIGNGISTITIADKKECSPADSTCTEVNSCCGRVSVYAPIPEAPTYPICSVKPNFFLDPAAGTVY